jgi:hypothetical protein
MKKYKLKKDLPGIKSGAILCLKNEILYLWDEQRCSTTISCLVLKDELDRMLTDGDWLEEIPEGSLKDFRVPPKEDCTYMTVISDGSIDKCVYSESAGDKLRYVFGMIVENKEEATQWLKRYNALFEVKKWIAENCEPFEPEWEDESQFKYYLYYDYPARCFKFGRCIAGQFDRLLPYLRTQRDTQELIAKQKDNLKIILGIDQDE